MTGMDPTGTCPACGSALAPGAPFCGTCGASVPATVRASVVAAARTASQDVSLTSGVGGATAVTAAPRRRVAAFFVDQVFVMAVAIAAYVLVAASADAAGALGAGTATVAAVTGLLVVPIVASALVGLAQLIAEGRSGATVGNVALGIRTVRVATTRPPGFGRAFLRRFIESLGGIVVLGQYVVAASSAWDRGRYRQGWQDKAAGTTMVTAASMGSKGARGSGSASAASGVLADPPPASETRGVDKAPEALVAPRPTGLINEVPGFAAAESAGSAPVSESTPVTTTPPVLPEAPVAPAEPLPAVEASSDDALDRTRVAAPKPLHVTTYRLAFDTGESLVVAGAGLIGRNPAPAPGEVTDHVIPITDPDRSVSKTHLAFGIGPDGFWVLDRGSTNGTAVTADGVRTEAEPGAPVVVPVGGTVEFGDRSFTVAPA